MADKTINNKHGAQITFSAREGDEKDIVLAPGPNRVSGEQFAQLKRDKVFGSYIGSLLEVSNFVPPPPAEKAEGETEKTEGK